MLGLLAAWFPAEVVGQAAGHRAHPQLVLGGHPHVVQHVPQVGGERLGRDPVAGPELDVDPGLGLLVRHGGRVVVRAYAEDRA